MPVSLFPVSLATSNVWILPFFSVNAILPLLSASAFSPKISYYEGNGVGLRKDVQKPSVKSCWTDGSIDAETLGKFQLGYSPDFRTYGYDLMPPQMDEDSAALGQINSEHPAVHAVGKSLEIVGNIFVSPSVSSESKNGDAREEASAASSSHHRSKRQSC